jgi:ribosomal protein L7/L12
VRSEAQEQKHILRRLAELEERVQALERVGDTRSASSLGDAEGPSAHVRELLSVGRKVEAIKAYQEETGAGLKEAKRQVESFGA